MKRKYIIWFVVLALLIWGVVWVAKLFWFRPDNVAHFFSRSYYELYSSQPERLSLADVTRLDNFNNYDSKLSEFDSESRLQVLDQNKAILAQLLAYDSATFSDAQKRTADLLAWQLGVAEEGRAFVGHDYLVEPGSGWQSYWPHFLSYGHYVRSKDEAKAYLTRLNTLSYRIKELIASLKKREADGIIPPVFLIEQAIEECELFVVPPPLKHPLYVSFGRRAVRAHHDQLPQAQRLAKLAEVEKGLAKKVIPAYKKLINYLQELKTRAPEQGGMQKLPNGDAYYQYLLKSIAQTEASPAEIHQMGLEGIAEISKIISSLNESENNNLEIEKNQIEVKNQIEFLAHEAFDKCSGAIPNIPEVFQLRIMDADSFRQKYAPAISYFSPDLKLKYKASLIINPSHPLLQNPDYLRFYAFYYSFPGIHLQQLKQAEQQEQSYLKACLDMESFTQGWGLYGAWICDEIRLSQTSFPKIGQGNPSRAAYLKMFMLNAANLVIDTGVHTKGWSREEAVDWLVKKIGLEKDIAQWQVDRIIASPAKYVAPWVGFKRILDRRQELKAEQGLDFSAQNFNRMYLETGPFLGLK